MGVKNNPYSEYQEASLQQKFSIRKKHSFSDDGFWAALKMLCFTPTFSIGTSQDGEEKEMWTHIPSQKVLGMELDL